MNRLAFVPVLVVSVLAVASEREDYERLCAFDPDAPGQYVALKRSLGESAKQTWNVIPNVNPADQGSILRKSAREHGVTRCPAADRMDKAAGIDPATGCLSEGGSCSFEGLDDARVAALSALPDRDRRVLRITLKSPADLQKLGKLTWATSLILNGEEQTVELAPIGALKRLRKLELREMTVSTLAPLGALKDLEELHAEHLAASAPLSLGFVAQQKKLEVLKLSARGDVTSDLAPLAKATQLEVLELVGVSVPDLKPIAGLVRLRELHLPSRVKGTTKLPAFGPNAGIVHFERTGGDLRPLAGLKNLERLDATGHGVTDLSPLSSLKKLKHLSLRFNQDLVDLTPLKGLVELETIDLPDTSVEDVAPLLTLPKLKRISVRSAKVPAVKLDAFEKARPGVEVRR